MANLDYNIMSGIRPIQLESPQNQLMQAYQLKGAQEASQMNALKMQEMQRGVEQKNRLRSAVSGLDISSPEANKLIEQAYLQEGDLGGLIAHRKSMAEMNKEQLSQQKAGAEVANLHFGQMHDYLSRLDPAAPSTVDAFKKATVKLFENPSTGDVLKLQGGNLSDALKRIDDAVATGKFGEVFNRGVLTAQQLALTDPARIKAAAEQFSQRYSEYVDTMARMGKQPVSQAEFRAFEGQQQRPTVAQPPPAVAPSAPAAIAPNQAAALFAGENMAAAPVAAAPPAPAGDVTVQAATAPSAEIIQTPAGALPVSTRGAMPGMNATAAALYATGRPEDKVKADAILAAEREKNKPEALTELGKLQRERAAASDRGDMTAVRQYDKAIKLKTEEASAGAGAPPVTLATIVDPNDPSKTIVIDARTGRTIGEANKQALGADLTAKDRQTREAKYPQATMAVKTFETKASTLAKDLEKLANHPGLSGISGAIFGRMPSGTKDSMAAQALYDSIVARGGFKELQDMRAASPTGGALGNVSNQEGQYLRDAFAPISRTQDTSDLANALKVAAETVRGSAGRVREAYDTTYEYRAGGQVARPAGAGTSAVKPAGRKPLGDILK